MDSSKTTIKHYHGEDICYPPSAPTNLQPQIDVHNSSSLVELSISCKNLPNTDIVGKSDPQVFVYLLDIASKKIELGRTEIITNNLNPNFVKKIVMRYNFESIQRLRFEVFDIDTIGSNDFLGFVETTLADIITTRGGQFKQALKDGPRGTPGYLCINVEELNSCKQVLRFKLMATDLPTLLCGIFNPSASVNIYRTNEGSSFTIIHKSKPKPRTNCPSFDKFELKLLNLCNGDFDRVIKFEFINTRFDLNYKIGEFQTTVNDIIKGCKAKQSISFDISSTDGKATISDYCLLNQASFLDYINAGTQIHFVIAIDFTSSNGDPAYPDSLHYLDRTGKKPNPYETALLAIGNILKPYDTMGLFAGFGFGAKLSGGFFRPPSHLFALNGNDAHPYVKSVDELVQVYREKLQQVTLSGPTNFSPCIAHCNEIASQFEDGNHYFVLLIVTDGIISDMQQTKRAIINASTKPLSIIICGVGDADFEAMEELDSDDIVMTVDGMSAQRDIVQFVPMNQFIPTTRVFSTTGLNQKLLECQSLLAEEVLREVPDQLTGYMVSKNFHPELTQVQEI